jgi:hypothetical protein
MTFGDRKDVLQGDLFKFSPSTGEAWTEPNLFDTEPEPTLEEALAMVASVTGLPMGDLTDAAELLADNWL